MKRIINIIIIAMVLFTTLVFVNTKVEAKQQFGNVEIYAPEKMFSYPLKDENQLIKEGYEVTLKDDGDLEAMAIYKMDIELYRALFTNSDAIPSNIKPFASMLTTDALLSMLFNYKITYARLLDKYKWEMVFEIDEYLSVKMVDGKYCYTFESDFLEVVEDEIQYDRDSNIMVVPLVPKENMSFAGTGPDFKSQDIKKILDAIAKDITMTMTLTFNSQDNYDNAKQSKGKVEGNGKIKVIIPSEIFPDINPGAGSWMRTALINTYGEDAILIDPNDNHKRYLEVTTNGAITLLDPIKYEVEYVFEEDYPKTFNPAELPVEKYEAEATVKLNSTQYTSNETMDDEGNDVEWIFNGWHQAISESGEIIIEDSKFIMPEEKVTVKGSWSINPVDAEYKYTKGAGSTYLLGSNKDLEFTVERSINDQKTYGLFSHLTIDDTLIEEEDYDTSKGSLKHTLKSSFLETLEPGTYTLNCWFNDDKMAQTTFKVEKTSTPETKPYAIPLTAVE